MTGHSGLFRVNALRRFLILATTVLVATNAIEAQEGGGMRLGGKAKTKTQPPRSTNNPPPQTGSNGTAMGWIMKFDPAKEGESEELLGTLSIKPLPKGSKAVKMKVRKTDQSIVQLANHSFESDTYGDVLKKGLLCSADWAFESTDNDKKQSKQKELRSLRFETSDVKGRIEEISEDYIVIRCKPTNDLTWPDLKDATTGKNAPPANANSKPKTTPSRKLKLRIIEDASTFVDAENKPTDTGDFETNQDVEATIVYGRTEGILVTLRAMSAKSSEVADDGNTPPRNTGGNRGSGRGAPAG